MKRYKLIVDSLCTIPNDLLEKFDIEKLHYSITSDKGDVVVDDFSEDLVKQICDQIMNKNKYQTTLYSPLLIEEKINNYLNEYQQVIYVCASPQYTGQYEATKFIQEKNPKRVFIINSHSICTLIEELVNLIINFYHTNELINQESIEKMVNELNNKSCTLLVPKTMIGLIHSGRIPVSLAKILKLAKITPIIKVEEKMKQYKLMKNNLNIDVRKILSAIDDLYKNKLKPELINKVYIIHTLINKEKIQEVIKIVTNYYQIAKEKIFVRANPLPIAVYTLTDSIGIGMYASINKKDIK